MVSIYREIIHNNIINTLLDHSDTSIKNVLITITNTDKRIIIRSINHHVNHA